MTAVETRRDEVWDPAHRQQCHSPLALGPPVENAGRLVKESHAAVYADLDVRWHALFAEEMQRRAEDDETLQLRLDRLETGLQDVRELARHESIDLAERVGVLSRELRTAVSEFVARDTAVEKHAETQGAGIEAHTCLKKEVDSTRQAIASLSEIVRSEMQVRDELVGGCSQAIRRLDDSARVEQETIGHTMEMLSSRVRKFEEETNSKIMLLEQTVTALVEVFRAEPWKSDDFPVAGGDVADQSLQLFPSSANSATSPSGGAVASVTSTPTSAATTQPVTLLHPLVTPSMDVNVAEDNASDSLWLATFEGKIERLLANTEETAAATQRLAALEDKVANLMSNTDKELSVLERTAVGFANNAEGFAQSLQREREDREESIARIEAELERLSTERHQAGPHDENTAQGLRAISDELHTEKARSLAAHRELTQAIARARDALSSEVGSRRNEVADLSHRIVATAEAQRQIERALQQQVAALSAAMRCGMSRSDVESAALPAPPQPGPDASACADQRLFLPLPQTLAQPGSRMQPLSNLPAQTPLHPRQVPHSAVHYYPSPGRVGGCSARQVHLAQQRQASPERIGGTSAR